jgi:hypothetical protein
MNLPSQLDDEFEWRARELRRSGKDRTTAKIEALQSMLNENIQALVKIRETGAAFTVAGLNGIVELLVDNALLHGALLSSGD